MGAALGWPAGKQARPLGPAATPETASSPDLCAAALAALPGRYKGGYWEEREAGQFTGCRDIFGPGVVGEDVPGAPAT